MTRQQLIQIIRERQSFLCVGLDTEIEKLPKHLLELEDPIFEFNKQIIDATRDLCVAYKPNLAFYEALGAKGWASFEKTVKYIGNQHFIMADAKRGDIGNTSRLYAKAFFENLPCDGLTVAPYMGNDSVTPFVGVGEGHWAVVLALTSNAGHEDFQLLEQANGKPFFETVIEKSMTWGRPDQLMFVVGATRGEAFKRVRELAPDYFLLVPGVGAQGGSLEEVCKYGMTKDCGLLVNSSRGIIYASSGMDFAERAREEALKLQKEMAVYLTTA